LNNDGLKNVNTMGKRLKLLRSQLNLTQEGIAEEIEMTYEKYGSLERGKTLPSYLTMVKLREKFNLDINSILDETIHDMNKVKDKEE